MPTIKDILVGFTSEQSYQERKKLTVSENGKKYHLSLDVPTESVVYHVDGNVIIDGCRCDKLILLCRKNWIGAIFVELKGRDIHHAIEQLEATLCHDTFVHCIVSSCNARIISNRIPRNSGNSELTRAKDRFKKNHNCYLRAINPGTTEKI